MKMSWFLSQFKELGNSSPLRVHVETLWQVKVSTLLKMQNSLDSHLQILRINGQRVEFTLFLMHLLTPTAKDKSL
jgi:hypothetical protein